MRASKRLKRQRTHCNEGKPEKNMGKCNAARAANNDALQSDAKADATLTDAQKQNGNIRKCGVSTRDDTEQPGEATPVHEDTAQ